MSEPTSISHYRIISKLGEGGMGAVFRATDTRLNRDVAIKVLPPAFAEDADRMARFEREAQVLASLNHPNIAAIYGLVEGEIAQSAIVMELVEGTELNGPVPIETAIHYARQIANALEAAHEKGVIHRDLKPANIKVTPDGTVKLLDFGLARATEQSAAAASSGGSPTMSPTLSLAMTQAGVILGTAAYMSPEQARGKPVDKRADIWAFGVVLFELLTGKMLFGGGETVSDSLAAVITKEPDWSSLPNDTPPHVRRLLERCLRKDPKQRLRDIGDARLLLDEPEPDLAVTPAPARAGARWWIIATAALAMALAILSVIHFRESPPPRQILRYNLAPPPNTSVGSFAVSPDGRYLAMAAGGQLWLRALDSLESQLLKGGDGASFPFWSPDGRNIAFFAQSKLKRIAIHGGSAQTLCEAPGGRGGAWNREGVIVFAGNPTAGLSRIPASGGDPAPLKNEGGRQRFPAFLPDGRFLYMSSLGEGKKVGVFVASLKSAENRWLAPDRSSPQYVAPVAGSRVGHLLVVRDETLMAQPVDPETLQPAGDPFPVAESVATGLASGNYGMYSISENGVLVYREGNSVAGIQLVWFDREGKELGTVGTPFRSQRAYFSIALSPDEKRLLVHRYAGERMQSDLWMYDLERGTDSRFTFDASPNILPVWSPDDRRVAFASSRKGLFNIYVKPADGAGQEELLRPSDHLEVPTDWSSDGRFILLQRQEEKTKFDIFALPLDGDRKPIALLHSQFDEMEARLSPDGRWLVYACDESGRMQVYVQPFSPGRAQPNAGKWQISTDGGFDPLWRKDGREIYYRSSGNTLMAAEVASDGAAFHASAPQQLLKGKAIGPGYAPSGDGKRFLGVRVVGGTLSEQPLTVVVNWQAGVGK